MTKYFLIQQPDWEQLRKQKEDLINLAELVRGDEDAFPETAADSLDGTIHFIDSIQDSAVESGIWNEKEVFGELTATEITKQDLEHLHTYALFGRNICDAFLKIGLEGVIDLILQGEQYELLHFTKDTISKVNEAYYKWGTMVVLSKSEYNQLTKRFNP